MAATVPLRSICLRIAQADRWPTNRSRRLGMWNWNGFHTAWGGMGIGMIGMGLFWILLIVVVVLFARSLWGGAFGTTRSPERTPLDVLKERYARGEIEKDEFERKRRDLSS